jgi:hypothetical protein
MADGSDQSLVQLEATVIEATVKSLQELIAGKQTDIRDYRKEIRRCFRATRRETRRSGGIYTSDDARHARVNAASAHKARSTELSVTVEKLEQEVQELAERILQIARPTSR